MVEKLTYIEKKTVGYTYSRGVADAEVSSNDDLILVVTHEQDTIRGHFLSGVQQV